MNYTPINWPLTAAIPRSSTHSWTARRLSALALTVALTLPATVHAQGAASSLRRLLESGRVPAERQPALIEMIVTRGDANDLAFVVQMLDKADALSPSVKQKLLGLLHEATTTRGVKPSGDLSALVRLIASSDAAKDRRLKAAAIRLAAAWKLPEVAPTLQKVATDKTSDATLRQAAIEGLAAIGDAGSRRTIEDLATGNADTTTRITATAALAGLDAAAGAGSLAKLLQEIKPTDDISPAMNALLARQGGAEQLTAALEKNPPPADAAKLALRYMYSIGRSDAELSNVLSKAAGIALDAPPPTQEEVAAIVAKVVAEGDAARGEEVFRREDLSCLKCHSVAGAGGTVGPDLSPVGSISPTDYIVNSIVNPNLAIKEQYVTRRVLTTDGQIITGIQIDRDDVRLRLRDATGKEITIPIDNIEQEDEGRSLMPQGLTKFLTEQEFLDLARFVSELGKPGPYAIRKTPTIQRWRVLKDPPPELTTQVPNVEHLREHVLDAPPMAWDTAYATVGGQLPLDELAGRSRRPDGTTSHTTTLYLQGELQVNEPGPITVTIETSAALQVWLDADPFEDAHRIERPLAAGRHTLTFRVAINPQENSTLRVELTKPAGSAAQFVVVNGM